MSTTTYSVAWKTNGLNRLWYILYATDMNSLIEKFKGRANEVHSVEIWSTHEIPENFDVLQTHAIIRYLAETSSTYMKIRKVMYEDV